MLDDVTPVLLTLNEAPNIRRTLAPLAWARDVVIVDSFSTDGTLDIAREHPRTRVFQRPFDTHAAQWEWAIRETGISTGWVLALDADYVLTDAFVREVAELRPDAATVGFRCGFTYCVLGKPLRGSLYPPVTVLFRRERARYLQDGHTQRVTVDGAVLSLRSRILHDDRKPLSDWLRSQDRYTVLEAAKLVTLGWRRLGWKDRLRLVPGLGPAAAFALCLVFRGGLLDGWPGVFYASQRVLAEALLSLRIVERRLGSGT